MARTLRTDIVQAGTVILLAFAGSVAASCWPLPPAGVEMIVRHEIGSVALYQRRFQSPVWPGAQSGVTVGIGYDLGYQHAPTIIKDWSTRPGERLATAAGIKGAAAKALAPTFADIRIDYSHARRVFNSTSLIEHHRVARRAFGPALDRQPPGVCAAIVSLVYNRGGSMSGPARAEMREIRDVCLPSDDRRCVAAAILSMVRLWRGSSIERGMQIRRTEEAQTALLL